ncbi:glycosyltransferase [Patescibacteria group bacterium]|nr:MAG: glycosyltransferase [Patescibacteria group bacterium]
MMVANFLNFLFNAFLGRVLEFEELGLIVLVNTLWMVASIFIGAVSSTVNHRTAYLAAAGNKEAGTVFLNSVLKKSIVVAIIFSALIIAVSQYLSGFFHIQDQMVFINFSPMIIFGVVAAVNGGFLSGHLLFSQTAVLILVESVIKFSLAVIFTVLGLSEFAYLSIPLSVMFASGVSLYFVSRKKEAVISGETQPFPIRFYVAALMTSVSATVFLTVDIILVKHFLLPVEAGQYVLLALAGKIIYFLGSLPNAFMISFISRDLGLKRDTRKSFLIIFGSVLILTIIGFVMIGPFGRIFVPLLFGDKTMSILPRLNQYAAAIVMFTLANSIAVYHLAKKQYIFPAFSFAFSVLMAIGISVNHDTIPGIVNVLFAVSAALFGMMIFLHFSGAELPFIGRLFIDFRDAFLRIPGQFFNQNAHRKILIFNWRDTRHKLAGGAEVYIQEIAKRWVEQGNTVTIFSGNDGKSPREDLIDGVRIIRRGGFYFVYLWAFLYYWLQFRGKYDIIIDSQNGVPFFAPLYAKEPIYALMHHVHQKVFWHSLPKHLAFVASVMEKYIMPLVYRKTQFITVSESSKQAMEELGLGRAGITIVYPGIDLTRLIPGDKSKIPTVLYLGRLKSYKSIDVLIRAFASVAAAMPSARLIIAGSGEEENYLKSLTRDLTLGSQIEFLGKVSEEDKISLLQKAWVFVNPSLMEGWGITTLEANACGTPVIASDVPGLRDSVNNPDAGYLVPYGKTEELSIKIIELLRDQGKREQMSRESVRWAKNFNWQQASEAFYSIIF